MTKHIAGIILFTFIIGSSAVIAGLFTEIPQTNRVIVRENYKVYKKKKKRKRNNCRHKRKSYSTSSKVNLSQVVFDEDSNKIIARMDYDNSRKTYGKVNLHFFANDKYGTRFLKTERIYVSNDESVYTKKMEWIGRLSSFENLYVIPEVRNSRTEPWVTPSFDIIKAKPVLAKNK